jgi:predicted ATP-grasp superfamily ATP-dependent carboligase
VEVNPRITSSYIALHESLNVNPAKLILGLADDENSTFKLPENMAANKVILNLNE